VVVNLSGRGDKDVAEVERVKREGYDALPTTTSQAARPVEGS